MNDTLKKAILAVVAIVLVSYAACSIWGTFEDDIGDANTRTLKDAETGELVKVPVNEEYGPFPMLNKKTGKKSLYPTEICFANQCEKAGGTYVILNEMMDKEGPTYCPKCGTLVRLRNPGPRDSAEGE